MTKKTRKPKDKPARRRRPKAIAVEEVRVNNSDRCLSCGSEMKRSGASPWCDRCYRRSWREFLYGNTCLYVGDDR